MISAIGLKKPKRIWIVAIVATAVAMVAISWPREREPAYHGKKLSAWLSDFRRPVYSVDNREAREAIGQIGTNAIPFLLKWIARRPPAWSRAIGKLHVSWNPANQIISSLQTHSVQIAQTRWDAAFGFDILGENASNAVPDLVHLLDADNPRQCWPGDMWPPSAYALSRIGNSGLNPLLNWVSDPHSLDRNEAGVATTVRALSSMRWSGANADLIISIIVKGLCSTNKSLALCSAFGLSCMNPEPAVVVPALRNAARMGNAGCVRLYLQCLGPNPLAEPRMKSILFELQNDPDPIIQREAKAALLRIPSAPTNSSAIEAKE